MHCPETVPSLVVEGHCAFACQRDGVASVYETPLQQIARTAG